MGRARSFHGHYSFDAESASLYKVFNDTVAILTIPPVASLRAGLWLARVLRSYMPAVSSLS